MIGHKINVFLCWSSLQRDVLLWYVVLWIRVLLWCWCYLLNSGLCCLFVWLSLPLFSLFFCLFVFTTGRGLTFTFVRVFVRARIGWAKLSTHRSNGPHTHTVQSVLWCSLSRATTACVSWPRDWAVSIGSHRQLDIVISQTPPRLGAPIFRLFNTVDTKNLKWARICPQSWLSSVPVATILRPAGRDFWHATFVQKSGVALRASRIWFLFYCALRQWCRDACRSNCNTTSARLSVLGATSASQSGRRSLPLKKNSNFQNLVTRSSLLVSLTTPAQGLPSQPSPNCCSTSLMGENTNRIVVSVLLSLLIHLFFSLFITLKYRIVQASILPDLPVRGIRIAHIRLDPPHPHHQLRASCVSLFHQSNVCHKSPLPPTWHEDQHQQQYCWVRDIKCSKTQSTSKSSCTVLLRIRTIAGTDCKRDVQKNTAWCSPHCALLLHQTNSPPTTSNLLRKKKSRIASIQTFHNGSNLFWLQHVQCRTTDWTSYPQYPSHILSPQSSAHLSHNTPQKVSRWRARLRHTLAFGGCLRKCTTQRETFISVRICRFTVSCFQSSLHVPRFQRPENSHLPQVHIFVNSMSAKSTDVNFEPRPIARQLPSPNPQTPVSSHQSKSISY